MTWCVAPSAIGQDLWAWTVKQLKPFELRAACVRDRLKGEKLQDVADRYGVSAASVHLWVNDFRLRALSLDDLERLRTTEVGKEVLRLLR